MSLAQDIAIASTSPVNQIPLKRFLSIAWSTELVATINDKQHPILLRVNNHWKPIQAYYAIYSLGEAVVYALENSSPESHAGCLTRLNNILVSSIKVLPWGLAYSGTTRLGFSSHNFQVPTPTISPLQRRSIDNSSMIATILKEEHRHRIEDWEPPRRQGKKLKLKKDYDPGYTTIFNFLYRLRIKSNYKESEVFVVDAPDEKIKSFNGNLSAIINNTAILLEIILIKRLGFEVFSSMADNFIKENMIDSPLKKRMILYKKVFSL
jgi:hypothetical protein